MSRAAALARFQSWRCHVVGSSRIFRTASTMSSVSEDIFFSKRAMVPGERRLIENQRFASSDSNPGGNQSFEASYSPQSSVSLLKEETELFLEGETKTEDELIELMQRWMESDLGLEVIAEYVNRLFQDFLSRYSEKKLPKTSLPFELTMDAWRNAGNGANAAHILDEWGYLLEGDMTLAPALGAFHVVMDAYTRSSTCGAPELEAVEDLLLLLEQWRTMGNVWSQPRVETYAHILRAMVRQEEITDDLLRRALETLEKLHQAYLEKQADIEPADVHFLIRAYTDVVVFLGHFSSMRDEASSLLHQMKSSIEEQNLMLVELRMANKNGETLEECTGRAYQAVIEQLIVRSDKEEVDTAEEIHSLVDQLEDLGRGGWSSLPWTKHYEDAIKAWAHCVDPQSETDESVGQVEVHCEDLLHRMEARHLSSTSGDKSDLEMDHGVSHGSLITLKPYENVLKVMSRCEQGDKAEALLAHIRKLMSNGQLKEANPFEWTRCWNLALMAQEHDGRYERVWDLWNSRKFTMVKPDGMTFAVVLKALSKSSISDPQAAWRALSMLKKMFDAYKQMGPNSWAVRPNSTHYGYVITAWSRSRDRNAARQAQSVFDQLQHEYKMDPTEDMKPSTSHFSALIKAWGRSGEKDAIVKAEKLFQSMQDLAVQDRALEPDVVTYSAMMDALSRQRGSPTTPIEAERLLDHLETVSKQGGKQDMQPNKACYTAVITAWGRSGVSDAPERAEEILRRLERGYIETQDESLRPDSRVYSAVLGVWANSRRTEAGDRAEELLSKMKEDTVLNAFVYSSAIRAHGASGKRDAPEKAEAILNEMEKRYSEGDLDAKPDTVAYTAVINAWAKSSSPKKVQCAWELLQRMCDAYEKGNLDVRPSVVTFTAVLNACAHARGTQKERDEAVKIALMTMTDLLSEHTYVKPNHLTFRMMIEVFGRNVQDESRRLNLASAALERCVEEGQVSLSVVESLSRFVPTLYRKLPCDSQGRIKLPSKWYRNVNPRGPQ